MEHWTLERARNTAEGLLHQHQAAMLSGLLADPEAEGCRDELVRVRVAHDDGSDVTGYRSATARDYLPPVQDRGKARWVAK